VPLYRVRAAVLACVVRARAGMSDNDYADKLAEHDKWPIGDTDTSAGTL
jgi:hypothetical protein